VPLCQNSLLIEDPFIGGETNPFGFDLCIECVDGAHFPSAAELSCVEHHLRRLDEQWADRWKATADADADSSKRSERTPPRPAPNPTHVVHIQFPSSPGSGQHAISYTMSFISFLHRILYPAPNGTSGELPLSLSSILTPKRPSSSERSRSATPPAPKASSTRKCRVLLWSSDGYTETSILALCLLMSPKPAHYVAPHPTASSVLGVSADASHTLQPASPGKIRLAESRTAGYGSASYSKNHGSMTLPEAYLELQITRQRSFFVYQNDLELLKRMESKLLSSGKESTIRNKEREREGDTITRGVTTYSATESPASSGSRWKFPTWGTRSGSLSIPNPPVIEEAPSSSGSSMMFPSLSSSTPSTTLLGSTNTAPRRRARASTSPMPNVLAEHWAWFNDPRFDGSFPSRVLPFLYLGNLCVSNSPSPIFPDNDESIGPMLQMRTCCTLSELLMSYVCLLRSPTGLFSYLAFFRFRSENAR
jgi:dual specificity MAP kinase phosphatase